MNRNNLLFYMLSAISATRLFRESFSAFDIDYVSIACVSYFL